MKLSMVLRKRRSWRSMRALSLWAARRWMRTLRASDWKAGL